jgi:single-stranded-DNA-specific exonuclease
MASASPSSNSVSGVHQAYAAMAQAPKAQSAAAPDRALHSLKQAIYQTRGATFPESRRPQDIVDPGLLKDGERAATRLAKAILYNQTIIAVADFDADGACGAAIFERGVTMLAESLNRTPRLKTVIPDRFRDGYGLKPALANRRIHALLPDVVVTIDNGISSHDAIEMMNGWPSPPATIVTDHHQPGDTLPSAYAIVNPNQSDCPFPSKALCGAGVVFYLLLLTRRALAKLAPDHLKENLRETQINRLSEFLAIATIGDVVPIDQNNRLLVAQGLARINHGWKLNPRESHQQGYLSYGVRKLLELAGAQAPITSADLAFKVAPQINAVGRLEEPLAGLACLLADTRIMADLEASHCNKANSERKTIQSGMESEANRLMDELADDWKTASNDQPAVTLFDPTWHAGVVGLVASRIKEATKGAVICFSPDNDPSDGSTSDTLKGSGRSENVHLRDTLALIDAWAPELEWQFGGHARAAGLSLKKTDLPRFQELFERAVAHQLRVAPLENQSWHDGDLNRDSRTLQLANWIESQPWGQQFPEPTFRGRFKVVKRFVMKEQHIKIIAKDIGAPYDAPTFELVWFRALEPGESPSFHQGDTIEADYNLGVNRWRKSESLQGVVSACRKCKS